MQIRESMSSVHVCEFRAHPIFNQSSGGSLPSYAISVTFAAWNFLLHATKGPVIIYVGGWGGKIMGWARPIFFREKGWVIVCVL